MIRRLITSSLLAAAALCAALPGYAQTKLLLSVYVPPSHFMQQAMREWAADVDKATAGEVKVEFAAGSLAPGPQQMSAVQSGIFDVGFVGNPYIYNRAPLMAFSSLPWLVSDPEYASVALWRTYEKMLAGQKQYADVQLLSLFHFSGGQLYSLTDTPINSIEELKTRRMWSLPGESADLLKALGLSPITSAAPQISESVSRGVVDGYYGITMESATDFKAAPYTKAVTLFPRGATSSNFSMFINKNKWASLSEPLRAAILSVSGEKMAVRVGRLSKKASEDALAKMKAGGVKLVEVDPGFYAALQKAAEPAYTDFHALAAKHGVDGKALLAEFQMQYDAAGRR